MDGAFQRLDACLKSIVTGLMASDPSDKLITHVQSSDEDQLYFHEIIHSCIRFQSAFVRLDAPLKYLEEQRNAEVVGEWSDSDKEQCWRRRKQHLGERQKQHGCAEAGPQFRSS